MKKILALVLALMMCMALVPSMAESAPVKVGVLVPVMTHGWVSGITYQAEAYAKELEAAGKIEYRLTTSGNAEEMTTQIDEAILWGAQILVIAPQWTGMEAPVQDAIDKGLVVVAFDMDIDADGVLTIHGGTGENTDGYPGCPWYEYREQITAKTLQTICSFALKTVKNNGLLNCMV